MRTKLLFTAMIAACSMLVQAQTIPNSSFENWSHDMDGTDSINGWSSSNDAFPGSNPYWLSQYTPAYNGAYSARLTSVAFGFTNTPINGILVNGDAYIEHVFGPGENHYYRSGGGTPIVAKPTSVSGYYQYTGSAGDHGFGMVVLFTYNASTGMRDTVGKGQMNFTNSSWQPFTININDMMPSVQPDSILTIFYASDTANPIAYEELLLDDITVNFPSSIGEHSTVKTSVFPNPSDGDLWIHLDKPLEAKAKLEIFNVFGQLVSSRELNEAGTHDLHLDLTGLSAGMYQYTLTSGEVSGNGKLVIR